MSTSQQRGRLSRLISQLQPAQTSNASQGQSNDVVLTQILPSGVGVITFNNPPVNSLPFHVLTALDHAARKFQNDPNVKAVIITGQKRFFCGGADITILRKTAFARTKQPSLVAAAHPVLNNIEAGSKPFVAAVNGFALGGGCEVALGAHYRIMSASARIGLVESTLGLIPGFGGTQRLPRVMGLNEALFAILTGRQFSAAHALRSGIVDEVCDPSDLLARAEAVALELSAGTRRLQRALYRTDKLPAHDVAVQSVAATRKRFRKIFDRSPCSENAATAVMGVYAGPLQGLQVEIEQFDRVIQSPSAKAQLHLFFAQRATTKIDVPIRSSKLSREIRNVAVLGGGTMGSAIAALLLVKGFRVILKEVSSEFLQVGANRILTILQRFEEKNLLRKGQSAQSVMNAQLSLQTDYAGFGALDLVVEAVLEKLTLKQQIFKELSAVCHAQCILATNTSTIDIASISADLPTSVQARVVGLHFFSPAHIMQLLEIIRTETTSSTVLSDMVKLSKKLGKIPVVVGNCVGFAANRMFFPYCQSAHFLLEHGVCPYRMDRVLQQFGMAMGVHRMIDASGVDVFAHVERQMKDAYNYCYDSSVLSELVRGQRLGFKAQKGIYAYDEKRNAFEDESNLQSLRFNINNRKQFRFQFNANELSDEEIVHMCLFPVVNEAYKILSQKFAFKASDLDIISTKGYGFPSKCGGVVFWGEQQIGLANIVQKLQQWSNLYDNKEPNMNLKRFFEPCAALIAAANS